MVPKTMCQCTQVCPLCHVQNMVIVVEFYLVTDSNFVVRLLFCDKFLANHHSIVKL